MKKKCSYKRRIVVISLLLILGLIFYNLLNINNFLSGRVVNDDFSIINKENLVNYLEKQKIIKDLPKDALISVKLYNFNSGSRIWEESYIIKKSDVEKGNVENPDIIIILDSKYVSELKDLCSAFKNAKSKGDLNYELKISSVKFLWKYKSLLKYKACFSF